MTAITCWGDSLTYGSVSTDPTTLAYPPQLANLLPGQAVNNFGVPGETAAQITTRAVADSAHVNDIVLFWMGHNDSDRPAVATQIASAVAHLGANTKYLVLSVITRTYEYPGAPSGGDALHTEVATLNAGLKTTYGSHYVDVLSTLRAAGNPFDATDVADTALGRIPGSLQNIADTIHLFDGAFALLAKQLARVIWANGWAVSPYALRDVVRQPSHATDEVLAVYDVTGKPLPRNVLLRGASSLYSAYASAGYFVGTRAVLDIQADTLARAAL